jgi:hypothetical protein
MNHKQALAFVNYRHFRTSPENRRKYPRAYFYVSRKRRLLDLVDGGGQLWVVTSYPSSKGSRVYSLAYKLSDCQRFEPWDHIKKEFGAFGVIGDPNLSRHYPRNDITRVLLDLEFSPKKPIRAASVIGLSLLTVRQLTTGDVQKLESFEDKLLHGRHVFISYSSNDRIHADRLQTALESHDHRVWRDVRSIVGGEQWEQAIYRAIENCDALVVLISKESGKSKWVRKELDIAKQLLGKPGKIHRIIPLILDKAAWVQSFSDINKLQWVIESGDGEGAVRVAQELARSLH